MDIHSITSKISRVAEQVYKAYLCTMHLTCVYHKKGRKCRVPLSCLCDPLPRHQHIQHGQPLDIIYSLLVSNLKQKYFFEQIELVLVSVYGEGKAI